MELAISTTALSKRFGDVTAVDRIELRVQRGEIYGFLGLNGAGKSTTIRMLLGMIAPSAGHVELFGQRVRASASGLWRGVGHLVENAVAYPELKVRENLEVARRLHGVSDPAATDRLLERMGLQPYAARRARTLSRGNLQRLALTRALVAEPQLLVLDEPANGLDPAGVVEIRELLRGLAREKGVTVFMSSHHLAEVDRLATRIGIVHRGRLIEELDSTELESRRQRRLEVRSRDLAAASDVLRAAGYAVNETVHEDGSTTLELPEERAVAAPDEVAGVLVSGGAAPVHLNVVQEDLEQHFMRLTRAPPEELR